MTDPVDGGPPSWVVKLLIASAFVLVVVIGVVLVVTTVRNTDTVGQVRELVTAIRQSQARADCRTEYNSDRQQYIEKANAIANQSNIDFAGFLLGDPRSSVGVLMTNRDALVAANDAYKALPTLDDMMEKGYRFADHRAHPKCPVVK